MTFKGKTGKCNPSSIPPDGYSWGPCFFLYYWSEQVWTCLQWWLPDVTSRGSLYSKVPSCLGGGVPVECSLMSRKEGLYSELIEGNGHGTPCRRPGQTNMTENINFQQLRWQAVINIFKNLDMSTQPNTVNINLSNSNINSLRTRQRNRLLPFFPVYSSTCHHKS